MKTFFYATLFATVLVLGQDLRAANLKINNKSKQNTTVSVQGEDADQVPLHAKINVKAHSETSKFFDIGPSWIYTDISMSTPLCPGASFQFNGNNQKVITFSIDEDGEGTIMCSLR